MTDRQKKMAAALAAVSAYVQQEEEAVAAHMTVLPPQTQANVLNLWGPSGRLEMMSMRRLIQMRAFDRIR